MAEACENCSGPNARRHHVVPKSRGGSAIVWLCDACHWSLHRSFSGDPCYNCGRPARCYYAVVPGGPLIRPLCQECHNKTGDISIATLSEEGKIRKRMAASQTVAAEPADNIHETVVSKQVGMWSRLIGRWGSR